MKSEGWFASPDGTMLDAYDHFGAVRSSPALFGFEPEEAIDWTRADRARVLTEVLRRGWLRARRRTHEPLVVEAWTDDAITMERVLLLVDQVGSLQAVVAFVSSGRRSVIES